MDMRSAPQDQFDCKENRLLLSRRQFLLASASLYTSAVVPKSALARQEYELPRLLLVLLRGGLDGLSFLVPFGDPSYESYRRDVLLQRESLIRVDSFFGLHPSLVNIGRLLDLGQAVIYPSVGLPVQTRSHFECQANLENGLPSNIASSSGWLNRSLPYILNRPSPTGSSAIALGSVPQILSGPGRVQSWGPSWFGEPMPQVVASLERMYNAGYPGLANKLREGIASRARNNALLGGLTENLTPLELAFRGAGILLGSADGPTVGVVSVNGWDTHNAQGNISGQIANRLSQLDSGIQMFRNEMSDSAWTKTVVICVSEFGRSVAINGTSGTDHGIGMPVTILGGGVSGGILGDWPGLKSHDLVARRDLRPVLDVRSIFKGVLLELMGVPIRALNQEIFPDSAQAAPPVAGIFRERLINAFGCAGMAG